MVKFSVKLGPEDSKQLADAASKIVDLVQKIDINQIFGHIDKLVADLGLSPDAGKSDEGAKSGDSTDEATLRQGQTHSRLLSELALRDVISNDLYHALRKAGIRNVDELAEYTPAQLSRLPGMTAAMLSDSLVLLVGFDLTFRNEA
jgi:hypothetical protein